METARGSTVLEISAEKAHEQWLAFVDQSASGGSTTAEPVPSEELPDEVEQGQVYFSDEGGSTRVTMELHYNPAAVKEAGLEDDWIARRITQYLEKFKAQTQD